MSKKKLHFNFDDYSAFKALSETVFSTALSMQTLKLSKKFVIMCTIAPEIRIFKILSLISPFLFWIRRSAEMYADSIKQRKNHLECKEWTYKIFVTEIILIYIGYYSFFWLSFYRKCTYLWIKIGTSVKFRWTCMLKTA